LRRLPRERVSGETLPTGLLRGRCGGPSALHGHFFRRSAATMSPQSGGKKRGRRGSEPPRTPTEDAAAVRPNTGRKHMRFMVMVRATEDSEAGVMPSEEMLAAMGRYNEELVKAGVMIAGEGLHPSSKGAR